MSAVDVVPKQGDTSALLLGMTPFRLLPPSILVLAAEALPHFTFDLQRARVMLAVAALKSSAWRMAAVPPQDRLGGYHWDPSAYVQVGDHLLRSVDFRDIVEDHGVRRLSFTTRSVILLCPQ